MSGTDKELVFRSMYRWASRPAPVTDEIGDLLARILERLDSIENKLGGSDTTKPSLPESPMMSRRDAARWLGVSQRTLDSLIYSGKMPSRVIGARRLIPLAELRKFARRDHPEPTSALRRIIK